MSKHDISRGTRFDARKIGKLLAGHRVSMVIMNACDSAQASQGATANLAAALLQQGIPYVLGMTKKLLTVTAKPLLQYFYQNYIAARMDPHTALYKTRRRLHTIRTRQTPLLVEVELSDYLLPVLYEQDFSTLISFVIPDSTPVSVGQARTRTHQPGTKATIQKAMVGRDFDLLRVESALALQSNIIELSGPLGCGKSHLVQAASQWWKETGFIHDVLGYKALGSLTAASIAEDIIRQTKPEALSLRATTGPDGMIQEAVRTVNEKRYLLVIDQFDEQIARLTEAERMDVIQFLQQISKTFVLLCLVTRHRNTLGEYA